MTPQKRNMYRISMNRLIFTCMNEILHDSYLRTKAVVGFDNNLMNKLHNMKNQLSKELKSDTHYIESKGGDPAVDLYHQLTRVFETMLGVAQKGDLNYFEDIIKILDSYNKGELKLIDEKQAIEEGVI